jgi:hypothetical protein
VVVTGPAIPSEADRLQAAVPAPLNTGPVRLPVDVGWLDELLRAAIDGHDAQVALSARDGLFRAGITWATGSGLDRTVHSLSATATPAEGPLLALAEAVRSWRRR